jgi:choline-sulfatase
VPVIRVMLAAVAISATSCLALNDRDPPTGVVIVTLDTTRADRLSPYGLMDASMPAFERLAREGVVFDQATSVAPLTLPAHCSLFTGLLPPSHGVRDNAGPPLAPERTTLAEILAGQGFQTAAFVGSDVLHSDRGLSQGFGSYWSPASVQSSATSTRQRRGDAVMSDAIGWLNGVGRSRFLLWLHLYDPHRPYDPPEPFRSQHRDPYVGEIAFADAQIGRLLAALDDRRLRDRTIVIVAGDHGESLGEHGERDHGIFVYESVLRVPLIVRAPALRATRIGAVVRLTDVFPSVLDLLDVPVPETDGKSLRGLMTGRSGTPEHEAYAESLYPRRFGWSPLRSLRDGRYKLIDAPRRELYDLQRDPFETRNLYDERRPLADALAVRLATLAGDDRPAPAGRLSGAPAELQQRLAALGYVAGASTGRGTAIDRLPDPKDCIGRFPGLIYPGDPSAAPVEAGPGARPCGPLPNLAFPGSRRVPRTSNPSPRGR